MDGLRFVVYDKAGVYQRELSGVDADATVVTNGISTATFTLDDDDDALAPLTVRGARCGVWFRGVEQFRGRVSETPGSGPTGSVSISVEGDMRKLWDWYGWPVPTAPLSGQTSEYRRYSGPTETVFKTALQEAIARLGVAWTVVPSAGRGLPIPSSSPVAFRFHPLADKLVPRLDESGLVIVLGSAGAVVSVDVREGALIPGLLTVDSGIADGYEFNATAPSATRAIVGGRGEGVARQFAQVIDAAREADWGDIIETFVDARNSDEETDITPYGREALEEGAPRAAISTSVVETDRFMFGKTYQLGDFVRVRIGPVQSDEQITSVSISESEDDGVVVTPHIGSADVDADTDVALARAVAALARGQRDQGRR